MRGVRFAVATLALLSAIPGAAPAEAPVVTTDPVAGLEHSGSATRRSVEIFVDRMAEDFLGFVLKTVRELDAIGVREENQRAAILYPACNALADSLLVRFGAFDRELRSRWGSSTPSLAPLVETLLEGERDRLEEFLRADPLILHAERAGIERTGEPFEIASFMEAVEVSTLAASQGPGFTKRLQRAAIVGESEVARVVRRRIRVASEEVGAGLADAYVRFLVDANRGLSAKYIFDTEVRASIIEPERRALADTLLAQYNAFVKTTVGGFKGTGPVIQGAAGEALAREGRRLEAFFAWKGDRIMTEVERSLSEGETGDGNVIMRILEVSAIVSGSGRADQ